MERTLRDAARDIVKFFFSDSDVRLEEEQVLEAFEKDYQENGGLIPSEEDCKALTMGNDDGSIPPELAELYPCVDEILCNEFGLNDDEPDGDVEPFMEDE